MEEIRANEPRNRGDHAAIRHLTDKYYVKGIYSFTQHLSVDYEAQDVIFPEGKSMFLRLEIAITILNQHGNNDFSNAQQEQKTKQIF